MSLDPKTHDDFAIAQDAESRMTPITEIGAALGLQQRELLPHGHFVAKVDYQPVLARLAGRPQGKYIDVTAITPTPLGEGKSTTSIGLVMGLGRRGKRVSAALRQPSGGPTMNVKGSAAGGGRAQIVPYGPLSLGLTGDINAVMNAHNLAMTALTARMQHERNYDDATLAKLTRMRRLDIDPTRVELGFVIDFCVQALRHLIIGVPGGGGKQDGYMMSSRFDIAAASEVMAILAMARDLNDLRARLGRMVVAYDKKGRPVTTEDLEVAGAMACWLAPAINPNLMQTIEGQPVFIHAGPFANIAIGQSSIIADRLGLALSDYHVTESGFGADIGFEKFWNLKCRESGLTPHAAVIVATIRALKCHGGAPIPVPGKPLPEVYTQENVGWVEAGTPNLLHHIATVKKAGINPVVCLNAFMGDTENETKRVRELCEAAGARVAVSRHWELGGEGALELADAVIDACNETPRFAPLYELSLPLGERIERVAREVYGADGVSYSPEAAAKRQAIEADAALSRLGLCMVKTHLSLSDDATKKGVPKNWTLKIRDILTYGGAGFIVPLAGTISLMPGTASDPAFRRYDIDPTNGQIHWGR